MVGSQGKEMFKTLSIFFVLFGVIVRSVQYLNNRSLWFDEANLALNIVNRSYTELLTPLDYNQAAPPGFLWIEKLSTQLFGNSEYSLRLFPFIAGIVSLCAFYHLANRFAAKIAVPIAVTLFATLPYTTYYTTEVKQYSSDVMIALLLTLLLTSRRSQILNRKNLVLLSIFGVIAIWISHPAIFILGGLELAYLLTSPRQNRTKLLSNRLPIYILWLVSFGGLYFLTISGTMENEKLVGSWAARYPSSPVDLLWLFDALGRFFYRPLGFPVIIDGVAIFAFIIGLFAVYRKNWITFFTLSSPVVVTLIASYLHKYPFRERLVLFLVPFFLIIIAEGIVFLLTPSQNRSKFLTLFGIIILISIITPSLLNSSHLIINPQVKEEVRPLIEYLKANQKPGDSLYIYWKGISHFKYYAPKYGCSEEEYVLGSYELPDEDEIPKAEWERYQQEFEPFKGQARVWFLFRVKAEEEERLLSDLNQIGQQVEIYRQPGAFICLYDFQR